MVQVLSRALILALGFSVHAQVLKTKVIYGTDTRLDYYQVTDAKIKSRADSTVALVRAALLTEQGDITHIATSPFGSQLALCPEEKFYDQETAAYCSGFLVAPDVVVTAGHCMGSQEACMNTKLVFGFRIDKANAYPRTVPTDYVYGCAKLMHSHFDPVGADFSVIKLDRPVTQFSPLPYRTSGSLKVGDGVSMIGYPWGLPVKIAGGANVRDVQASYFVANLNDFIGNSGSAVFNSITGEVEGVLVRGTDDWDLKGGCYVSKVCPTDGCRGEDVTLFDQIVPHLK